MKPTPITKTKHGHSVRIRCGKGQNPRFTIPSHDETVAQRRADDMVELARQLVAAGHAADAPNVLKLVGEGHVTEANEIVDRLLAASPSDSSHSGVTFQQLGERWTSGELAREYPDHVKVKATSTSESDHLLLSLLYPSIGAVPLSEFSLADAKRAMATIRANRRPATRRQYAQVIARILNLAVWPCEIIERSPLPRGFLPKINARPGFTYLQPLEDRTLLGCREVPLGMRLLYGVLAREGMRLGEARRLRWRHVDLVHGTIRLDVTKTGEPRVWALRADVARVLKRLGADQSGDALVFRDLPRKCAAPFRGHLRIAKLERAELYERTDQRRPIRVHDLRATFITLNLAAGRSEAWICDRTGHKSSQMINAYRRAARTASEINLGELSPLDQCIPELADLDARAEVVNPGVSHGVSQSPDAGQPSLAEMLSISTEYATGGASLLAPQHRTSNPVWIAPRRAGVCEAWPAGAGDNFRSRPRS